MDGFIEDLFWADPKIYFEPTNCKINVRGNVKTKVNLSENDVNVFNDLRWILRIHWKDGIF